MRKASIRDLRIRTSELVRDAEQGETIIIERRGQPVAELTPIRKRRKQPPLRDLSELWNRLPRMTGDSTQYISEDRDRGCT
jgi:prevent-host-death family protein